jgi:type IV secretory pathway VirB2 component (pilin)
MMTMLAAAVVVMMHLVVKERPISSELAPRKPVAHLVLQWCHSGVTRVLQCVAVVLTCCYNGFTVVLQWCDSGVMVVLETWKNCTLIRFCTVLHV